MAVGSGKALARTVALGVGSAVLYLALYLLAGQIVERSAQGGWMFVIPVAIAFLFSMVHGAFTGHFWDVLGFKAKK
jgi:hypothetical protein